jgi:hypothetical protein
MAVLQSAFASTTSAVGNIVSSFGGVFLDASNPEKLNEQIQRTLFEIKSINDDMNNGIYYLLQHLFTRAFPAESKPAKKSGMTNELEFKHVLSTLLTDVLSILYLPEFPVSEYFAVQFTYLMVYLLNYNVSYKQ